MSNKIEQVFIIIMLAVSVSLCQHYWCQNNPVPTNEDINSIYYGNGKYAFCGKSCTIYSSSDLVNWQKGITKDQKTELTAVAIGNNILLATSDYGEMYSSTDGNIWESVDKKWNGNAVDANNGGWNALIFAKGMFVAAGLTEGDTAAIFYSSNGVTWNWVSLHTKSGFSDVAFNGSLFLACGNKISATSSDGIVWIAQHIPMKLTAVVWAKDRFIAMGIDSTGTSSSIFTSTDGSSWTNSSFKTGRTLKRIAWNGKVVVITTDKDSVITSADFTSWTVRKVLGTYPKINDIIAVNDTFVGVGVKGALLNSLDGVSWTVKNRFAISPYFSGDSRGVSLPILLNIAWAGSQFVMLGEHIDSISASGYSRSRLAIFASSDGYSWSEQLIDSLVGHRPMGVNGKIILLGSRKISLSTNGKTWKNTTITSDTTVTISAIEGDGNKFIAVGTSSYRSGVYLGKMYSSNDGIAWFEQSIGLNQGGLYGICYGNGKWVAVGGQEYFPGIRTGISLSSSDGVSWTKKELLDVFSLGNIWWVNNRFVAQGGFSNDFYQSSDGITWVYWSVKENIRCQNMIWANPYYVIHAQDSGDLAVFTSANGSNWTKQVLNSSKWIRSIVVGANKILAVGDDATILACSLNTTAISLKPAISFSRRNCSILQSSIKYSLDRHCLTTIRLFDVRGRLIRTLVNSLQQPGSYSVALPKDLSAGSYIISLRAGEQKMDKLVPIGIGQR